MYEAYYEVDHEANDAYSNMLHEACFEAILKHVLKRVE
jgi:hypothetical protein